MGRLYFLKMASSPDRQLQYSVYLNRDVTVYKLNVPYDREIELYKFLENDILPENRIYLYDHFYDNCATRIRDMMDIITDGEFSERYNVISDKTLRVHLRRFIYSHPFMDWLLNFAMNGSVDRPVSELAGMYLPLELERGVAGMMIHDKNGEPVPFVRDIVVVNRAAGRAEIKAYPPPQWPYGLTFGLVLAAAAWFMKGKGFALFSTLLSFILAVPGTLLFFHGLLYRSQLCILEHEPAVCKSFYVCHLCTVASSAYQPKSAGNNRPPLLEHNRSRSTAFNTSEDHSVLQTG